jgi:methionyl-tRNA formyltransferase
MIVFASKFVGLECLKFLFYNGEKLDFVVISSNSDEQLVEFCVTRSIPHDLYSEGIVEQLAMSSKIDWIVNLWSPHKLPVELLGKAERRINLHPGLLPYCGGNDCAAWAIRENVPIGVSLLEMNDKIDAAELYLQKEIKLDSLIRGSELHKLLQLELIELFKANWSKIRRGDFLLKSQNKGGSHHTRRQTENDRVKSSSEVLSIAETIRWMLAHDFFPGTTAIATIDGKAYSLRLELREIGIFRENQV